MNAFCRRVLLLWVSLFLVLPGTDSSAAAPRQVGDINSDGELSVVDLTLLRLHVRGLEELTAPHLPFADVNQDGVVNEDDARALIRLLTGEDSTRQLPLTGIRETSPNNGEESVSSSRRTGIILRFSMPVERSLLFNQPSVFGASVNGVPLRTRAELSSDGRKLALFPVDEIPAERNGGVKIPAERIPGNARVDIRLDTAGIKDLLGREIDGDGDGQPGGVFKFYYLTESLVVVPNTEIKGKVFASEKINGQNVPLAGVIVRVAGTENAQVLTGADGAFTLPCPAGRFFAEVDGRKVLGENAFPDKAYYPYVVKAWEAVAGSVENLAVGTGEIFLPIIPAGALQEVDPTKDTKVQAAPSVAAANPEFAEISLSVPAGALRKEDGTSGGKIGMAPVPADRLPEPLAPGLDFPLVITIQTDGAGTFDQPVAVKFPNLPDQNGNKLKAGEKTGLWSFNHDTGSWELQGPMTVTDDGKYVTTDPGVGVRQPGWHGVLPGSQGVGPKRAASAPLLPPKTEKEVDEALKTAAQSSLRVRDAFMKLGQMRGTAEDLEEVVRMLQELKSLVASYNESGSVPHWWGTYWLKLRIAKLRAGYDQLLPGGSRDLAADLAVLEPHLNAIKGYLEKLDGFNKKAYADADSYTWLSTQFADSNTALLGMLSATQAYLNVLKPAAAAFSATAFPDVAKVLFPGFGQADPTQGQEMEAFAKFLADLEAVSGSIAVDHAQQFRNLKLQMSDYLARAGALSIARSSPSKYGYIKVDAIGEPQRIRSNAAGDYRMVLPPDREFSVTYVDPKTLQTGAYVGISGWNGTVTDLYGPVLAPLQHNAGDPVELAYARDTDGDKLADALETVIGTDASKADTDGDGTNDHREVTRGKNPLSGLAVGTGVIFSASTSQEGFESTDVDAGNELLLLSERRSDGGPQGGLMIYSLESKTEPLRQAFLSTEYPVYRVRYADTNLAILSLHENGVAVVDISSPTNPMVISTHAVQPGESVNSAILVGDILVLGVNDQSNGKIVLKDLASGETIREEPAGGSISDLVANGTVVYALSKGNKSANEWWWYWNSTSAVFVGDINRLGALPEGGMLFHSVTLREWEYSVAGGRLALAPGKLFYVYESGLTGLNIQDPLNPKMEGDVYKPDSGFQLGWNQVVFDGSVDALGKMTMLAAIGSSGRGNSDVDGDVMEFQYGKAGVFGNSGSGWWRYWLNADTPITQFQKSFDSRVENPRTGNLASGKVYSLTLAGGIAYAADKEQGLKVINYKKYDSEGLPPSVVLHTNSPSPRQLAVPRALAGSLLSLTASPSDDVAVASVEWYLDGARVAVTGGSPWGYTLRLPLLDDPSGNKRIRLEARVYDTGGNMTSTERLLDVVEDPFPPAVLGVTPASSVKQLSTVSVTFNEPMDQASLTGSLTLVSAGTDGKLGTADDVPVGGGSLSEGYASVTLDFSEPLPEGLYRALLSGSVADVAGNTLGAAYTWDFGVALANRWLGGRGLWSDSAMWSSGAVPVAGESVVFPAGAQANVVVGGRASFRPGAESLLAGTSTFSRVLTKNAEGVVSVAGGANGSSITPIYAGMHVRGAMVEQGTYVKSVKVTEDTSDPANQTQTTVFELSQPLVEGAPGGVLWTFVSGGSLDSVTVKGDTTLLDVDLELSGTLSLSSQLGFGGDSSLGVGTLLTEGSAALLSAAAVVDTGSLVAGRMHSGAARLKLTQPLLLSGSLALESAGFRDAEGKLTTSRVQLSGGLDFAGHELRIFGGYAGSVALQVPVGGGTFALTGPGKLAFDWKESLFDEEGADWDKFLLRVSAGELVLPEEVTLDVAGLGQVNFFASKLTNYGTVRIADQGWLKAYNYERVGDAAKELLGQDALLEVLKTETGNDDETLFSSDGEQSFALKQDGSLWAWGANWGGQLGVGSTAEWVTVPTQVGTETDWKSVNSAYGSTIAQKQDGSLWAWGSNWGGQLGVGSTAEWVTVPTQVGTETDWKSVNRHGSSTFAQKQDGSLWAWGYNWGGQLGVGSTAEVITVPTQVGTETDWKFVSTVHGLTFGLKQDGSLWAWGYNWGGQLGVGSAAEWISVPTQIGTATDWKSVNSASGLTFAQKDDGSLWAWGYNWRGRLGVGSTEEFISVPTRVGTATDWKSVNSASGSTFAQKDDGSLWAWGYNWGGRLGVGSTAELISVPTQVGTETDWKSMNSGDGSTYALKQGGSLWAWGYNWGGRLGVGSTAEWITVPTQVGTATDWKSVSKIASDSISGSNDTFGRKLDGTLWAWGYNGQGQLGVGNSGGFVTVPTLIGTFFADAFPPAVSGVTPAGTRRQVSGVSVAFGEPMHQASLAGSLTLRSAGPDGLLGTADDVSVQGGILSGGTASVRLDFLDPLPEGLYRAVLSGSVADVAGNTLGAAYTWDFGVALVNSWLGGSGLWSDPAKWSFGTAPVAGDSVMFPAGAQPNLAVGGRAAFRPAAESLVAGSSTFTRVVGTETDGVVRVVRGGVGTSTTPIHPGMQVRGAMVAEGTYVKKVTVSEFTDVNPYQLLYHMTVFELSEPLVEGAPGASVWTFTSSGSLDGLTVTGDTTLVDVDLAVGGTLSLSARLAFGGDSTLGVGTLLTEGSGALLSAAAVVDTGSLVAGRTRSGAARLKLTQPLLLSGSLALESAGFRDVDGKLAASLLQLSGGLDLAGHELRILGGYAGSLALQGPVGGGTFALTGPGRVAFDWKKSLFDEEGAERDRFLLRVSAGELVVPGDVTLEVAGLGQVSIFASKWTNYGTVRIADRGWLKAYNYERVGDAAKELLGQDALLEVLKTEAETDTDSVFSTNFNLTFALKQDGSLWAWGNNSGGGLGFGTSEQGVNFVSVPTQVGTDTAWKSVHTASSSTFAQKQDGSLWAWGWNVRGRLGVGSDAESITVPTQVGIDSDWSSVRTGYGAAFALKEDGSLWAWGGNFGGRLGLGSAEEVVAVPTQVGVDTDWKSVNTIYEWTFALKQDGSLWAWGENSGGQLGVGSTEQVVTVPTQVGTATGWKFVTGSYFSTFALKEDGSLWAWGGNLSGQLGLGSQEQVVTVPTQVGTATDWKFVTLSGSSAFALKKDGSLWAWGDNQGAKLGLGSWEPSVTVPTQVGKDRDWKSVVVDSYVDLMTLASRVGTFAQKQDGSLWAWGENDNGTLGVGSSERFVTTPMQVGTDTGWESVTSHNGAIFAHKPDGSLWAWGTNWSGELGLGSTDSVVTVPTRVDAFADAFPPAVSGVTPAGTRRQVSGVSVAFGEPMHQASLAGSLTLRSAGPDGRLGTADDVSVQGGILSGGTASVRLDFLDPLPEGLYRAVLSGLVADVAGNTLGAAYTWDFGVALANSWLGGLGLWSDPAKWSFGHVPANGESVVFPAGVEPNVVVGGRAAFRPALESLVAGTSNFTRQLTRNAEGVFSVSGDSNGSSTTPIAVGMLVTGAMVAEGTYVRSATVTEDLSDPSNQIHTTVFELSQPLVEGVPGPLPWQLTSGGRFESVAIKGDTALVDVDLVLAGTLSLSARLAFGGDSTLGVGTLLTEGSAALLSAAAVVNTGSLVASGTHSGAARLKLTQPLVLSGSLALESAGFRDAEGKLTVSQLQLTGALDLAGHELRIFGGYAGLVALQAPLGGGTFAVTGPGTVAFDWKKSLFDEEGAERDKLRLRVSAGELMLPGDVTLDVAGRGRVSFVASKLTNHGSVRIADQGWLKAYNYMRVGTVGLEVLGQDAVFDKVDLPTSEGDQSTWSSSHTIKQDGTLWAWGWNGTDGAIGLLGTGSVAQYLGQPEQVGTDTDWKAVFGNHSFFAIRTDGTLWAWGNNSAGDGIGSDILGVGSAEAVVTSPQQVGVDANWKTVLATAAGAVALKTDGSLWAWGWNRGWTGAGGVLGTASLADYIHEPEQVGTDSDWTGVYGGQGSVFFATKTDGSLWAWGQNEEGQLGVGYVSPVVTVPTPVAGEAVWVRVAVGYGGGGTLVLGLQLDGSLWEWGAKTQGIPQQIGTDRSWKKIGFRGESTVGRIPLAMKTDGSLWAWGYQTETSPGIFEEVTLPTLVASNVPWVGLPHYGPGSNVSLKTDGTLWQCAVMWDAGGGLGVVFTQVGQESDWAGFAGADLSFPGHCRLFKADGSLWRFENHPEEIGGEWVSDVAPVEVTTSVPWKRR